MKHALEIWRDEMINVATLEGERKGKREGERKGKREKALEIADKLMTKGMSIGDVADTTGLTVDEILQR